LWSKYAIITEIPDRMIMDNITKQRAIEIIKSFKAKLDSFIFPTKINFDHFFSWFNLSKNFAQVTRIVG